MTYNRPLFECSGNCSGSLSFPLDYHHLRGELQPFESPLHRFRCRADVALRSYAAAVPANMSVFLWLDQ